MSLLTDLQAAVESVEVDAALFHSITQGDDTTIVTTEGGPVWSLAKAIKYVKDTGDASVADFETTSAAAIVTFENTAAVKLTNLQTAIDDIVAGSDTVLKSADNVLVGNNTFNGVTTFAGGVTIAPAASRATATQLVRGDDSSLMRTFLPVGTDAAGVNLFQGPNAGNLTMSPGGGATYLAGYNMGFGVNSLSALTTGWNIAAFGHSTGSSVTSGNQHAFFGSYAGASITTAVGCTLSGNFSGILISTGDLNTASGEGSLRWLRTGERNVAKGHGAGYTRVAGSRNIDIGETAGLGTAPPGDNGAGSPWDVDDSINIGEKVWCGPNQAVVGTGLTTDIFFGSTATGTNPATANVGRARMHGSGVNLIGLGDGKASATMNPQEAGGTVQLYTVFGSDVGAAGLAKLYRGNGASIGANGVANGLNLDIFGGLRVRINQLGGSGDELTLAGGVVRITDATAAVSTSTGSLVLGGGLGVAGSIYSGGFGSFATGILGVVNGSNAASGRVGEFLSATLARGSAVSLATITPTNVTSLVLTAGDWDVSSFCGYTMLGATTTQLLGSLSDTSASLGADDETIWIPHVAAGMSDDLRAAGPTKRISVATTTTVYLVAWASFSAGTVAAFGHIRARRVR